MHGRRRLPAAAVAERERELVVAHVLGLRRVGERAVAVERRGAVGRLRKRGHGQRVVLHVVHAQQHARRSHGVSTSTIACRSRALGCVLGNGSGSQVVVTLFSEHRFLRRRRTLQRCRSQAGQSWQNVSWVDRR